jgi:predicted phosphodiesterase
VRKVEYKNQPIIISPNIGIPRFLNDSDQEQNSTSTYKFNVIVVSNEKIGNPLEMIQNHLFALPLFDLDPKTNKLIRGQPISIGIESSIQISALTLQDEKISKFYELGDDRVCYLLWHNFFGKKCNLFKLECKIDLLNSSDTLKWLNSKEHSFLMFDLQQTFSNSDPTQIRINYHSLVIWKKPWDSFQFAHISDLHLAKRYDELLGVMAIKSRSRKKSIQRRYQNPNNHLRDFISWANKECLVNKKLDFVFITGDIVDYYLKNKFPKMETYHIDESNWGIFLNIILNKPIELRPDCDAIGVHAQQEIALPIFTLTGNHDVRVHGYPITSLGNYRKFRLTLLEANKYSDPFKQHRHKSLTIDKYCLGPYYQHINPYDDYFLNLGSNSFLFLNSGSDSFLDLKSLLMASPSAVGFSKKQYKFAFNVAKRFMKEYSDNTNNFLISHAPILNPQLKNPLFRKIAEILKLKKWVSPEIFKETSLRRRGVKEPRADNKLDFTFGTITHNWLETLALMYRYQMIALGGHTHNNREFRYIFCGKDSECSIKNPEITEIPFAIYWDNYTKTKSSEYLQKNKPFVLQTPSLGISDSWETKWGGFRIIEIKDNKILSLSRNFVSDLKLKRNK